MATSKKAAKSAKSAAAALQGKTENLPAVVASGKLTLPEGFKAKRNLQLPSLVLKKAGEQRVLLFQSNMEVSTVKPKDNEAFATVADVVDFQTGEQFKLLVPAVVESTFIQAFAPKGTPTFAQKERFDYDARAEAYAATDLRGKLIAIRNAGKTEGKRHVNFEVVELEAPAVSPAN